MPPPIIDNAHERLRFLSDRDRLPFDPMYTPVHGITSARSTQPSMSLQEKFWLGAVGILIFILVISLLALKVRGCRKKDEDREPSTTDSSLLETISIKVEQSAYSTL